MEAATMHGGVSSGCYLADRISNGVLDSGGSDC